MTIYYAGLALVAVWLLGRIADRLSRIVVGMSVITTAMVAWLDHPDNPEELRATARVARKFLGLKTPAEAGIVAPKEDA